MTTKAVDHPDSKADAIIEHQKKILEANVWRSCVNCEFWGPQQMPPQPPGCLKFNSMPPPEVVVVSCPEWLPVVPF